MSRSILVLLVLLSTGTLRADYLVTYRPANIKAEPVSEAASLERVGEGVRLSLLDDGVQTNGYYHVTSPAGTDGWVYRTLVRRHADDGGTPSSTGTGSASSAAGNVEVTAIDVGAGLSCLIKLPNNRYIIYDGGNANPAMTFLKSKVPAGAVIEMLILSHTDADHWGAVAQIINYYKVKKVIRTDYRDGTLSPVYQAGLSAIENVSYTLEDHNLGDEGDLTPGSVLYNKDGVKLYSLCGFKEPVPAWNLSGSKANNAISIVVRLEYAGHSIILAGDAVGRDDCAEDNACIATEKYLVDRVAAGLLNADVLVAAHHGADNASCELFISKVSPEFVIFSAGNAHRHPRQSTAERFIDFGVDPDNIFRTDRGYVQQSDGGICKQEWADGTATDGDTSGDDHVKVVLPKQGKLTVAYLTSDQ
jgi:beta-lactamase superfamily II metal-dependent hydrolase